MTSYRICAMCKHFFRHHETADVGQCRRYPPTMPSSAALNSRGEHPFVTKGHWCGEFASLPHSETPSRDAVG